MHCQFYLDKELNRLIAIYYYDFNEKLIHIFDPYIHICTCIYYGKYNFISLMIIAHVDTGVNKINLLNQMNSGKVFVIFKCEGFNSFTCTCSFTCSSVYLSVPYCYSNEY